MIGLLQRVSESSVIVDGETVAEIGHGLLVMIGIEQGDEEDQAGRLLKKLLTYRVFPDKSGRMNCNIQEAGGSMLLVPQFTLVANTSKGNRPGFSNAASPELSKLLFEHLASLGRKSPVPVHKGCFGETMEVNLCNEGPVTFWLRVKPKIEEI
ncbi:MAG: D-tyrosyl-tRNA(Tyr) deacylase [Rhodospirillaceae bacterium]|nr:D-tyrosyl-tRNA(Tyr) deacylase [Rhodospirillaceae bacterium]